MRGYVRVFEANPTLLAKMLALRLSGWGNRPLAELFKVDRTTIEYWCIKFEINPVRRIIVTRATLNDMKPQSIPIPEETSKTYKYSTLLEEEDTVKPGTSYERYRVQARKRELVRLGILNYGS